MLTIDFAKGYELPPYWQHYPQAVRSLGADGEVLVHYPQAVRRFDADLDGVSNEEALAKYSGELLNVPHACPMKIGLSESAMWQLPIEPVITIAGKNRIVRRSVLKQNDRTNFKRGTIKELWSQDDYEITIAGLLINGRAEQLPEKELMKLREFCEARQSLFVHSQLFRVFNIKRIAIESYEFPFTKGVENQLFTIKGYSDEIAFNDLFIES